MKFVDLGLRNIFLYVMIKVEDGSKLQNYFFTYVELIEYYWLESMISWCKFYSISFDFTDNNAENSFAWLINQFTPKKVILFFATIWILSILADSKSQTVTKPNLFPVAI